MNEDAERETLESKKGQRKRKRCVDISGGSSLIFPSSSFVVVVVVVVLLLRRLQDWKKMQPALSFLRSPLLSLSLLISSFLLKVLLVLLVPLLSSGWYF